MNERRQAISTLWIVSYIALWVLVLVETGLLVLLLRAFGGMRQKNVFPSNQISQFNDSSNLTLAVGEQAPSFTAIDERGVKIKLDDFQEYRVLAFFEPGCSACDGAIKALNLLMQDRQDFVVLAIGGLDQALNKAYAIEHEAHMMILTPDMDVREKLYHVPMVPFVFVLDEKGIIQAKGIGSETRTLQSIVYHALELVVTTP